MKFLILFAVLAGLGFGGYQLFLSFQKSPAELRMEALQAVSIVKIRTADIAEEITTSAEVRPIVETEVKSEINGRIISILVKDGDWVSQGQALVELDRENLAARLDEARRSVEADSLRLEQAERNYRRLEALRAENFANEADFLDAKTRLELAKIDLDIRRTRVNDAQKAFEQATVLAPHDGTIIDLNITEGQVINGVSSNNSGTTLMKVADLSRMYLEASLSELEVAKVSIGKDAEVTFDAIPGLRLPAKISQISASARRIRNRPVFPTRFTLQLTDPRVKPGTSGKINIPIDSVKGVVALPIGSLYYTDRDVPFVYVKTDDGFSETQVEIGLRNLNRIEVRSGLATGDTVARVRPPSDLIVASLSSNSERTEQ